MMRKILVVGDSPICGGRVLPYQGSLTSFIHGHQVALVGGRAYCEGCHSVGLIAKAGGPRRIGFISEVALEGDVVICHCPKPQPIVSVLQSTTTHDDMWQSDQGAKPPVDMMALPLMKDHVETAAMKRLVDDDVTHPPEAEQTENICPNMTNKEFCNLVLGLRDKAVSLISRKRLPELERWNKDDMARVEDWFGVADQSTRDYLRQGFASCVRVLRGLDGKNFVRYSELTGKNIHCVLPSDTSGVVAAVCKPDVASHTIGINLGFCNLRKFSAESDSQLLTLIHEVTHFDDCFGSFDDIYKMKESLKAVKGKDARVKTNADNIAGYVVWGERYAD
jgi:uncharacterized Zn-binding protein involved in type VI secretion